MNVALRSKPISRRTMLRGCGATLALPLLEIMQSPVCPAAQPVAPPRRAAFFYVPNGIVPSAWYPQQTGAGFSLSPTLQPLAPIRKKITVFSGLDRVKVPGTDGHAQASTCWLSSAAPDELSPAGYPLKRTLDQIIASETGKHTPFRSLELSCNPYEDNRESVYFDNISWYGHGHVARSLRDPQLVFNRLFRSEERGNASSLLDLVLGDAKSLRPRLGNLDRGKLDEYLDSVRALERQLSRIRKRQPELNQLKLKSPQTAWQNLERSEFIQIMGDLMILALRTDLTRVSTLMIAPERWSTPQMVHGLFDKPIVHHNMSHAQGDPNVRRQLEQLDKFHVQQFAMLVAKMEATPEGEGSLLDSMLFTMGSGLSNGKAHVYSDLPIIVAGTGGGALTPNRHHRSAAGTPVGNLWLSLAQTMGVRMPRFADSTQALKLS